MNKDSGNGQAGAGAVAEPTDAPVVEYDNPQGEANNSSGQSIAERLEAESKKAFENLDRIAMGLPPEDSEEEAPADEKQQVQINGKKEQSESIDSTEDVVEAKEESVQEEDDEEEGLAGLFGNKSKEDAEEDEEVEDFDDAEESDEPTIADILDENIQGKKKKIDKAAASLRKAYNKSQDEVKAKEKRIAELEAINDELRSKATKLDEVDSVSAIEQDQQVKALNDQFASSYMSFKRVYHQFDDNSLQNLIGNVARLDVQDQEYGNKLEGIIRDIEDKDISFIGQGRQIVREMMTIGDQFKAVIDAKKQAGENLIGTIYQNKLNAYKDKRSHLDNLIQQYDEKPPAADEDPWHLFNIRKQMSDADDSFSQIESESKAFAKQMLLPEQPISRNDYSNDDSYKKAVIESKEKERVRSEGMPGIIADGLYARKVMPRMVELLVQYKKAYGVINDEKPPSASKSRSKTKTQTDGDNNIVDASGNLKMPSAMELDRFINHGQ